MMEEVARCQPNGLAAFHNGTDDVGCQEGVLPPLSVGEMTLRPYSALNYSQNSIRDLRCVLNGA